MARASGLALVGGAEGNDPIAASTHGTGELIAAALEAGASRSHRRRRWLGDDRRRARARSRAMFPPARLRGVEMLVACDVRTQFVDAAEVFGPQKGATPAQVELLRRRLERLAQIYLEDYGVDVREIESSGAAGGLAGGLAAIGAQLVSGFDLVATRPSSLDAIEGADLVITGEGFVDAQSFEGKVVGGVAELAASVGVPVLVVAGRGVRRLRSEACRRGVARRTVRATSARMTDTLVCIEEVVAERLKR